MRAGHHVTFADKDRRHVDAINDVGLSITGPVSSFRVRGPAVHNSEIQGQWAATLLCVKAQDTVSAVTELLPCLTSDGFIVSVQNGLNELTIVELAGRRRTVGAFVNFQSDYMEPGTIMYGGRGAVVVGELDGRMTPRLAELTTALKDFEPDAISTSNIWGFLWGKMAYVAMLFGTAVTNDALPVGFGRPEWHQLFTELAREVLRVATSLGIMPERFDGFNAAAFMPDAPLTLVPAAFAELVAFTGRSKKTHSGMWRDIAVRKRPTEVAAQLGAVIALASQAHIPTPLLDQLTELIHRVERGELPQDRANLDNLAAKMEQLGTSGATSNL
jgi:2-dehydropantoate 2-reductase